MAIWKNKYILCLLAFGFYLAFLEDVDVVTMLGKYQQNQQQAAVNQEKKEEIEYLEAEVEKLNDPWELERFARENYLFHKDDEDVFVITTE